MNKNSFLMYIRDDNYLPIGAVMVQREFEDCDDLFKVAVSLCHPKEIHQFRKKTAWTILNGKMLSSKQYITFTKEALEKITLLNLFLEFNIPHLRKIDKDSYSGSTLKTTIGNVNKDFAETQLDLIYNNTERFRRTFKMMTDNGTKTQV